MESGGGEEGTNQFKHGCAGWAGWGGKAEIKKADSRNAGGKKGDGFWGVGWDLWEGWENWVLGGSLPSLTGLEEAIRASPPLKRCAIVGRPWRDFGKWRVRRLGAANGEGESRIWLVREF